MKKVIANFIVIPCFLTFTAHQIDTYSNKVLWKESIKLTWDDFKGAPDNNNEFSAITNCGYGYEYLTKKDSIIITVTCYFQKNMSWVKENAKTNALLKHEQRHFDLAELNARKFRKLISLYHFKTKNSETTLETLFNKSYEEFNKEQQAYDNETDVSRNNANQTKWEKMLTKQLQELKNYSTTTVRLATYKEYPPRRR